MRYNLKGMIHYWPKLSGDWNYFLMEISLLGQLLLKKRNHALQITKDRYSYLDPIETFLFYNMEHNPFVLSPQVLFS